MDSKIVKQKGLNRLCDVCVNGASNLKSFREIAQECNLKPLNAGRITAILKKGIHPDFLTENRQGPANHVSQMLEITGSDNQETSKNLYIKLSAKLIEKPKAGMQWEKFFKLNCNFKFKYKEI